MVLRIIFVPTRDADRKDKSAVIGRKLLQEADTRGEFQRRLSLIETILANKFPD
ncbi:MAG: hypothetical protein ACKPE1_28285 [Dolichospermum sp.]